MYIRNVHCKYNIFNIIYFKHFSLNYLCTLYVFLAYVQYKLHFYTSFSHYNSRHHLYTTVLVHILRLHLHTTFVSILYVRLTMSIQNDVKIFPDKGVCWWLIGGSRYAGVANSIPPAPSPWGINGMPCASPVGFMGVGRQRYGQSAQVRVRGTVVWGCVWFCLCLSLGPAWPPPLPAPWGMLVQFGGGIWHAGHAG